MEATPVLAEPAESIHPSHLPIRQIAAGTAGNIMEWYDFAIYGYFAVTIGEHFFPSHDRFVSLIAAFGVFAAGFLMRPLGGIVFGHIGDRVGRQTALVISVLAMAIPTFLMGILPGYATLGPAAAGLLVILRMIQGLSVGGEYTTSIVFLVESAGRRHRGFAGSWSGVGVAGGMLLGSATGALVTLVFSPQEVHRWAWRLPFIVGLSVGLVGLYIRWHMPQLPLAVEQTRHRSPVWEALCLEWRATLRIGLLNVINGVGFYVAFVFLVTYMQLVGGLSEAAALEVNTATMIVLLTVLPIAGWLSDRVGARALLITGISGFLVLSWPLFWAVSQGSRAWSLVGQGGFAVLFGLFGGAFPVAMVETTPRAVRCSVIAIGYNICLGVLGGISPLVATWLIRVTHHNLAPAFYVMAAAVVSLVVALRLPLSPLDRARAPVRVGE